MKCMNLHNLTPTVGSVSRTHLLQLVNNLLSLLLLGSALQGGLDIRFLFLGLAICLKLSNEFTVVSMMTDRFQFLFSGLALVDS